MKTLMKLVILSSLPLLTLTQVSMADHHGQTCPLSYKFYKLTISKQLNIHPGQLDEWMKNTIKHKYGQHGGRGKCWFQSEPMQDACMSIPGLGPEKASGLVCQIWLTDGKKDATHSIQWCNDWSNSKNLNIGVYAKGKYANCSKTITQTCGGNKGDSCTKVCKYIDKNFIPSNPNQTICPLIIEKGLDSVPSAFKDTTSCACDGTPLRQQLDRVANYLWPNELVPEKKVMPPRSKDKSIYKKN